MQAEPHGRCKEKVSAGIILTVVLTEGDDTWLSRIQICSITNIYDMIRYEHVTMMAMMRVTRMNDVQDKDGNVRKNITVRFEENMCKGILPYCDVGSSSSGRNRSRARIRAFH